MNQHVGHAKRVSDQAGVLAAGTAEAVQRISGHVIAALHRNLLDRVRHVFDRDPDETVGDLLATLAVADFHRHRREGHTYRIGVERLILLRSEDFWKKIRNELAD